MLGMENMLGDLIKSQTGLNMSDIVAQGEKLAQLVRTTCDNNISELRSLRESHEHLISEIAQLRAMVEDLKHAR